MIREHELFHGVVLKRLVSDSLEEVSIRPYPSKSNSSYVVNDSAGIFIKYSTKRLSPWRFTFKREHQDEILKIKRDLGRVYLVLVCHHDGIVVLSFDELKKILDETYKPVEWISVTRRKREMYLVKGSDGSLNFKVGRNEFPKKITISTSS